MWKTLLRHSAGERERRGEKTEIWERAGSATFFYNINIWQSLMFSGCFTMSIRKQILTLQRKAVSSKYQLTIYQLTQHNIPADLRHHQHCCERLRSRKIHLCLQRHTITTQASGRLKTVTQKYEVESNENLKSAIKIRPQLNFLVSFNNDTHGLEVADRWQ